MFNYQFICDANCVGDATFVTRFFACRPRARVINSVANPQTNSAAVPGSGTGVPEGEGAGLGLALRPRSTIFEKKFCGIFGLLNTSPLLLAVDAGENDQVALPGLDIAVPVGAVPGEAVMVAAPMLLAGLIKETE